MAEPSIGKPAPDFKAPATGGKEITLSEFKDKANVILFFYPSAFLPIEARELTGLETEFTKFKELETQIIACSPDTVWANTIFAASLGGLSFPLIGDIKKEVIKIYNVLREDGLSERATFIIDKDGILKWKKIYEISTERKISELLEELRKFKQQS